MAKIKRVRTYVFFVQNTKTNQLWGVIKTYNGWELHNTSTTYHQVPKIPPFPVKKRIPTEYEIKRWKEDHDNQRIMNRFKTIVTTLMKKKLPEDCKMFYVRAGSAKCPVSLDWETVLRQPKENHHSLIGFTVK